MKQLSLFFAASLLAASSFAQRSIDLDALPQLLGPASGSKHQIASGEKLLFNGDIGGTEYWFTWRIKNLGPDSLVVGDTLKIRSAHGVTYRYAFSTKGLKKDSSIGIIPVNSSGQQIAVVLSPTTVLPYIGATTTSQTKTTVQWCDSVYAYKGTSTTAMSDPDMSNNKDCHTVEITYWIAGINNVTYEADGFVLYPNPASGRLNMKYDFATPAREVSVVLRDVIGKAVYQKHLGTMTGTMEFGMNIGHLPAGMYVAELNFNGQKITSKVSVN